MCSNIKSKSFKERMFIERNFDMWKKFLVFLISFILVFLSGCNSAEKARCIGICSKEAKKSTISYRAAYNYGLDKEGLQKTDFAGKTQVGNIEVSYPRNLQAQAECIADHIDKLLSYIQQSIGLQLHFNTVGVYLFRVDKIPQNFEIKRDVDSNEFYLPLFVEADNESCSSILSQNFIYPCVFVHEIVEASMAFPKEDGPMILIDIEQKRLFFKEYLRNYTRWFREGLSSYAGYLAYKSFSMQQASDDEQVIFPASRIFFIEYPFSSLGKVGRDLFKWHAHSPDNVNKDYYCASFGLFLLIENRFGKGTIKKIMQEVNKREYVDGKDLLEIVNNVIDIDAERLVEDFHFPRAGLQTKALTKAIRLNEGITDNKGLFVTSVEADSLAERAGIKKKDVVVKVGNRVMKNNLEFELAIFENIKKQIVEVVIWRDKEDVIVKLPLTIEN